MTSLSSSGKTSPSVAVWFARPTITMLFTQLLSARGVKTTPVPPDQKYTDSDLLITEPQFFLSLPRELQARSLVVGERSVVQRLSTLYLDTPLTEEKIERAFSAFLDGEVRIVTPRVSE